MECFLVERYESDVEEGEEGEGENILLTLSDRFLEEKDINGKVLIITHSYINGMYIMYVICSSAQRRGTCSHHEFCNTNL